MRTWGRAVNQDGSRGPWTEVSTTSTGSNDLVYVTTLCQVLLLNLGESPFFANYGIPAQQSVLQQVFPDYYVSYTQQMFAPYFANLLVSKNPDPAPNYNIQILTHEGVPLNVNVPIPY
jgi:hypothetical protein